MNALITTTLLVAMAAVITGCKIAVIVPSGGDVESTNPAYNCEEGKLCEFEISTTPFNESFTAIPKAGYEFEKWSDGGSFFCGKSTDSTCTVNIEDNATGALAVALFQSGYVMPIFKDVGIDTDGDGVRNALDEDDDNDGVLDVDDAFPLDPYEWFDSALSGPTFKILETHPSKNLACMDKTFNSLINVFGIYVISTSEVPKKYLQHTANVLAQYLDNDADGKPDDQKVASYLADNGYVFPLWTASARDKFWEQAAGTPCEEGVKMAASLYYPGDQWAIGGIKLNKEWDTNLEEVWHLVTAAFYEVYPEDFSDKPSSGSTLVRSMDKARGGSFQEPPSRYPSNAWYTNGEGPYEVQAHEYLYWALMSNFNALSAVPGKCQEVQPEWKVCTKKDLKKRDPGAYKLLNQRGYAIPTKIPDGRYKG